MLNINMNDLPNVQVVPETYDLLKPTDYMTVRRNEFLLHRPNARKGLYEVRIRSFKPIISKDISNVTRYGVTVKIYPVINGFNFDSKTASTIYLPDYVLYNENEGVRLPVKGAELKVEFTGDISQLINDINDAIAAYCSDFDLNGTLVFGKPDGSDLNYLTGEKDAALGAGVSLGSDISGVVPLNNGQVLVSFNDGSVRKGTPDNLVVVEGLTVTEPLKWADPDVGGIFNCGGDTKIYRVNGTNVSELGDLTITLYASKAPGYGIIIAGGRIKELTPTSYDPLVLTWNFSALAYINEKWVGATTNGGIVTSTNAETWTDVGVTIGGCRGIKVLDGVIYAYSDTKIYTLDDSFRITNEYTLNGTTSLGFCGVPVAVAGTECYGLNDGVFSSFGTVTEDSVVIDGYIVNKTQYFPVTLNYARVSLGFYYQKYSKLYPKVPVGVVFTQFNEDLTVNAIAFNFNKYILNFAVEVTTDPIDLFDVSVYSQTFGIIKNLRNSWVTNNISCTTKSVNFERNLIRAGFLYNGYTLTLASPCMGNGSLKVYTGYTEPTVNYKVVLVSPSDNFFPVYITNKHNEIINLDYLSTIYDQVIVEVDYLFQIN